jgi:hypothetical protein
MVLFKVDHAPGSHPHAAASLQLYVGGVARASGPDAAGAGDLQKPLCPLPATVVGGPGGGPAAELRERLEAKGVHVPPWAAALQGRAPQLALALRAALLVGEATVAAVAAAASEARQVAGGAAATAAAAAAAAAAPLAGGKGAAAAAAKAAAAAASAAAASAAGAVGAGGKAGGTTAKAAAGVTPAPAAPAAPAPGPTAAPANPASSAAAAAAAAAETAAAAAAAAAQLQAAVELQLGGLGQRLALVAFKASDRLSLLAEAHAIAHAAMAEWLRARYAGECSAVAALDGVVRAAAAEGRQLPFDLRLEVSEREGQGSAV